MLTSLVDDFGSLDYKIDSTNSSIDSFVTARKAGDTSPFTVAAVIDMGVFGADGVTVKKRDAIPSIDPALNHTTIGRLYDTAADYDFVVRAISSCHIHDL